MRRLVQVLQLPELQRPFGESLTSFATLQHVRGLPEKLVIGIVVRASPAIQVCPLGRVHHGTEVLPDGVCVVLGGCLLGPMLAFGLGVRGRHVLDQRLVVVFVVPGGLASSLRTFPRVT